MVRYAVLRAWVGAVLLSGAAWGCAVDVSARARSTAARDLSCAVAETRIVDQDVGLYRIRGCGVEATYRCAEDRRSLAMRCRQLAAHAIADASAPAPLDEPGASASAASDPQ